jgi:hypothetical protein
MYKTIPDIYPFALPCDRQSIEYYSYMEWCGSQGISYRDEYMYWRGNMRFKNEGIATMCKLAHDIKQ